MGERPAWASLRPIGSMSRGRSGDGQLVCGALATFFVLSAGPFLLRSLASIPACSVTLGKGHVLSGPLWDPPRQKRLDAVVSPLLACTLCHLCRGWQVGELDCAKASSAGSQRALWAREFGLGDSHVCGDNSSRPGGVTLAGCTVSLRLSKVMRTE